jgi:hypothetical protein
LAGHFPLCSAVSGTACAEQQRPTANSASVTCHRVTNTPALGSRSPFCHLSPLAAASSPSPQKQSPEAFRCDASHTWCSGPISPTCPPASSPRGRLPAHILLLLLKIPWSFLTALERTPNSSVHAQRCSANQCFHASAKGAICACSGLHGWGWGLLSRSHSRGDGSPSWTLLWLFQEGPLWPWAQS